MKNYWGFKEFIKDGKTLTASLKEKVETDLLQEDSECIDQNWIPRKGTPEETYDIENDPESIVFFDDVRQLVEVIVEIAKGNALVPIIERLIDLLE